MGYNLHFYNYSWLHKSNHCRNPSNSRLHLYIWNIHELTDTIFLGYCGVNLGMLQSTKPTSSTGKLMEKNASKHDMQYWKNIMPTIIAMFLLCIPGQSTIFSPRSLEIRVLISIDSLTRNLAWSKISVCSSLFYYQREIKIWENRSKNNI